MQLIINFLKGIFQALFGKPTVLIQPQPVVPVVVAPVKPSPSPINPTKDIIQVIITRTYGQKETTGILNLIRADGTFWTCRTLELPWLDNKSDVSCIPTGNYPAALAPFHNVMRYLLSGTNPRFFVFIHDGNYATGSIVDTAGCILLGNALQDINNDGQLDVIDSVATIARFMAELKNQPFTLQIR